MSGRDIVRCRECGAKIETWRDWRGRLVNVMLAEPKPWHRQTWIEVEMGEFVAIYRHECDQPPQEKPPPYDGRDVRPKIEKPLPPRQPDLFS